MKMEKMYKCCYGLSSATKDNKHIFMIDFDNVSYYTIYNDLLRIQHIYKLSDFYIIESTNGYNALTLDKISLKKIYEIGIESIFSCRNFYLYGYDRKYYVLRFGDDKKLEKILKSSWIQNQKSNAHRLFLEHFFNIKIDKDKHYDDLTKCDLIQYPSDKDGYHEQKLKCKHCNGTGKLDMFDGCHIHKMECDYCNGTGDVIDK